MKILITILDTLKGLLPIYTPTLTSQDNVRRMTLPPIWSQESGFNDGDKIAVYAIGKYLVIPPKENDNE